MSEPIKSRAIVDGSADEGTAKRQTEFNSAAADKGLKSFEKLAPNEKTGVEFKALLKTISNAIWKQIAANQKNSKDPGS